MCIRDSPYTVHNDLRNMMQEKVGIVRTEDDLVSALEDIGRLRERAATVKIGGNIGFNPGWHLALDLENMLDISEAVTRSALLREERRGAHTREDFPETDDETWGQQNLVTTQEESGEIAVRAEPLPEMPDELKELIKE